MIPRTPARLSVLSILLLSGCGDSGTVPSAGNAAAGSSEVGGSDEGRPNILLIVSDDIGTDVSSSMYPGMVDELAAVYGPSGHDHPDHGLIRGRPASTPTLDRLARDGFAFSNVWAHPFCSPTRAAILTGKFGAKTGVLSYADALGQGHTSFVRELREQGRYSTGLFGKWHLAGLPGDEIDYPGMKPKEAGFDVFRGNLHAAIATFWEYDYQIQDDATPDDLWRTEAAPSRSLPGIASTSFAPVVKAADAIEWIRAQETTQPDRPWFAWLAFNLSHATIERRPSQMAVPDADTLDRTTLDEMRACGGVFGTADPGDCSGEQMMRAMTNAMDTVIAAVLDAVDVLDPNTYVIYVGDNGTPMYGRPGLDFIDNMYISRAGRGKGTAYESGARVPLVFRGPGIEAGGGSAEFAHVADLFSTVMALAGLEPPASVSNADGSAREAVDSVSLVPLLAGDAVSLRDPDRGYVLTETLNLMTGGTRQVGARNARYKLICTNTVTAESCEFYDLATDPLEEYPLEPVVACDEPGTERTTRDPQWHYCQLADVMNSHSFL